MKGFPIKWKALFNLMRLRYEYLNGFIFVIKIKLIISKAEKIRIVDL